MTEAIQTGIAALTSTVTENLLVIVPAGLALFGVIKGAKMLPGLISNWTRG